MNGYKGDEKNRKLMIPVAAIFMSVVALVGIGYATMTSTVENNDNTVLDDGFYVDLYPSESLGSPIGESIFDDGVLSYVVNTKTSGNGNEATVVKEYVLSQDEIVLNSSSVYLGLNEFTNGQTFTVTMTINATASAAITGYKLYEITSGSETSLCSVDSSSVSASFVVDSQFTQIVLKATPASGPIDDSWTMPTIDVKFSVSSEPISA